jgi:hypothetical protein
MSQEEVITPRASALRLVVASWLVLDVGKSGLFTNGVDGAPCGLWATAGAAAAQLALFLDPTLFVKSPSFVRPSVLPSIRLHKNCSLL